MKNYSLTVGWLYPELMSTYGDKGNIIAITKRCQWRGIKVSVKYINEISSEKDLLSCDLLIMGGAQDTQQEIVAKDLKKKKQTISKMIEDNTPGLYICGGFQYMGDFYKTAEGNKLPQLGILNMHTENPGKRRLIGNIIINSKFFNNKIIGFENHGGRTILGKNIKPLGEVVKGYGSNDTAKEEGAIYKNTIGTYLHGPILPKNPFIADYLIKLALEKKYNQEILLENLDDSLEEKARIQVAKMLSVTI